MISFKDDETKAIFDGISSKSARRRCPPSLWNIAKRKMDALNAANRLEDLRSPGNNLERLKDDRTGQHSIRINDKYRVCFVWKDSGAEQVEITDYH
ncbi:MAG: type II toxin-antitoxin system RelE/ParE family toxin [Gemmatimonadaceae bacterium]|nr:type II toxin-antitoxin system RelE/ParE family toxin [Gemmatimonadaceae bacterium]